MEEDRLALSTRPQYTQPRGQKVDSYVKFNLPNPTPFSKWFRNNDSRGMSAPVDGYSGPKMLPPHFGLEFPKDADYMEIRLFQFCEYRSRVLAQDAIPSID